jgi:transposase
MRPYSQDLRERVMAAVDTGQQSLSEIAQTFRISESTVDKWCQRQRDTGSVAARPFAGGRRRVLQGCGAMIRAAVKKQPDVSLAELCERVQTAHGLQTSPSMMCRELQRLKLPLKKSRSMTASARRPA